MTKFDEFDDEVNKQPKTGNVWINVDGNKDDKVINVFDRDINGMSRGLSNKRLGKI